MLNVEPQQWAEWKRNSVTLAVMNQIQVRLDDAKDMLAGASNERDFDQFLKGMIKAFSEVLDVQLELTIEEDSDEVSVRDPDAQSYS